MTWLISRALMNSLCSRELAEEFLAGNYSDGEQSAPLSVMLTAQQFWRNDKMMDCSKPSLFGLKLKHLTVSHGEELLMLFLGGFRAKRFPSQDVVQELPANDQDSGKNLPGLLAKYDPDSHSLRTAQLSLIEDSMSSSAILPRSGMMRNGCVYQRPNVALTTSATESGFWQTPGRQQGKWNSYGEPKLSARVKLWPTPTARDYRSQHAPDSQAHKNRKKSTKGVPLTEELQRRGEIGKLNPTWTEWLMGWPVNWTNLRAMCNMDFILWGIANGAASKNSERKALSKLWFENDPSTMGEWKIRLDIQEQEILLNRMQQFIQAKNACGEPGSRTEESAENVRVEALREMPRNGIPEASQGWKSCKQFGREYNFLMPRMPRCATCKRGKLGENEALNPEELCGMWVVVPAEKNQRQTMQSSVVLKRVGETISRVTVGKKMRVDRIKALGEGQVPICAAMAFRILAERFQ